LVAPRLEITAMPSTTVPIKNAREPPKNFMTLPFTRRNWHAASNKNTKITNSAAKRNDRLHKTMVTATKKAQKHSGLTLNIKSPLFYQDGTYENADTGQKGSQTQIKNCVKVKPNVIKPAKNNNIRNQRRDYGQDKNNRTY
jgi:hypothetical protein